MTDLKQKQLELYRSLEQLGSGAVATSAGGDSSYLLYAAHEVLGDNAVAITAKLRSVPREELEQAQQLCKELG
ncbi:MAG: TIGR00268 family protein, partial [Ruminococcus sp.]|nr:TIGR00268 family protein [Ruminococcus sp.]